MAARDIVQSDQVVRRLSVPRERWGWEFNQPAPPQPYSRPQPTWREPPAPPLETMSASYAAAKAAAPKRGVIAGAVLMFGLCLGKYGIPLDLVALGLAAFWFVPLLTAQQSATRQRNEYALRHRQTSQAFEAALAQWRAEESRWRAGEEQRVASANQWFPVEPKNVPTRLDVFGGVSGGWSDFLVTVGSGLLAAGGRLTIVDLSEAGVADRLVAYVGRTGAGAARISLPEDLHEAGLLDGMDAEEVAEVIAEALHTRRGSADNALRELDTDILREVGRRLDGRISFDRLVAALRIVQRSDDPCTRTTPLSAAERQKLADYADGLTTADRMQGQVQELRSVLESLTGGRLLRDTPSSTSSTAAAALTVFVSEDPNTRRRDLLDRLVVRALIHRLRRTRHAGDVIAVAGADHLGVATIEELSRAARVSGVRIVLLLEHLREEYEPYLGGSDSISVFMRMGNAKEAGRAAEHIGRGHTFQLTQLSRTEGTSTAHGTTSSFGHTTGSSSTRGRSGGGGPSGWNESNTTSHGESSQRGTSETTTNNESKGETQSRVYEFTVEPTRFQDLDASGFILVEPLVGGGRRVVAGTCDPAMLTLGLVADEPLIEDRSAARPAVAPGPGVASGRSPLGSITIADPAGEHRPMADRLHAAGYLVEYRRNDSAPFMSGWVITGHRDGRPLNEVEVMNYR